MDSKAELDKLFTKQKLENEIYVLKEALKNARRKALVDAKGALIDFLNSEESRSYTNIGSNTIYHYNSNKLERWIKTELEKI